MTAGERTARLCLKRAMRLRQLCFPGVAAIGCAFGCGSPTAPETGTVRPGLYVLATIDHQPPLFFTERVDYGDTLSLLSVIVFDSIRIVDDTLFQRHYALASYRQPLGGPPVSSGTSYEINAPGVILPRDEQVLLLPPAFVFPVPDPDVFVVRPEGLLRRVLRVRAQCTPLQVCTTVSRRYVDALYTRR